MIFVLVGLNSASTHISLYKEHDLSVCNAEGLTAF